MLQFHERPPDRFDSLIYLEPHLVRPQTRSRISFDGGQGVRANRVRRAFVSRGLAGIGSCLFAANRRMKQRQGGRRGADQPADRSKLRFENHGLGSAELSGAPSQRFEEGVDFLSKPSRQYDGRRIEEGD